MSPVVRSALVAAALFLVAMSVAVHHAGAPTIDGDAALVASGHGAHHGEGDDGTTGSAELGIAMTCLGLLAALAGVLRDPRPSWISGIRSSPEARTSHRPRSRRPPGAQTPVALCVVLLV
jgi:hypothetical protein